jgi:hypothetical protein
MARGEAQKTEQGNWRRAYGERRFGVLLVILVALLAGPPVLPERLSPKAVRAPWSTRSTPASARSTTG